VKEIRMKTRAGLAVVIACAFCACGGGADKPAASPADTSSLEPKDQAGAGDTSAAPSGGSGSAGASDDSASKPSSSAPDHGAPASSAAAAPAADAPAAAVHPTPSAMGTVDGKAFAPKIARATAAMHKDGRLLVTLTEGTECGGTPKPGEGQLSLLLEWKDGYKTDIGSLKRATKPGGGEVGFSRGATMSKSFKPTGRVTVVSAPTDANSTGKLKLDVQSGDLMLAGDIDVLLCVAAK
jgi:hypothetical protein